MVAGLQERLVAKKTEKTARLIATDMKKKLISLYERENQLN
jgi:hypothetical protein